MECRHLFQPFRLANFPQKKTAENQSPIIYDFTKEKYSSNRKNIIDDTAKPTICWGQNSYFKSKSPIIIENKDSGNVPNVPF